MKKTNIRRKLTKKRKRTKKSKSTKRQKGGTCIYNTVEHKFITNDHNVNCDPTTGKLYKGFKNNNNIFGFIPPEKPDLPPTPNVAERFKQGMGHKVWVIKDQKKLIK